MDANEVIRLAGNGSDEATVPPSEPNRRKTALAELVCCPRCRSSLSKGGDMLWCSNALCRYATDGFPVIAGQPVLIDFEHSIFRRQDYEARNGTVLPRDDTGSSLRTRVRRFITGGNPVAEDQCKRFLDLLTEMTDRPRVLVVGGGPIGAGVQAMYRDPRVEVFGVDVYASVNTCLVADGHHLPFKAGSFDGVWIQAVLEHVLEPQKVVDEIARVLAPGGLVYADTPFMQQVHEEAYDFTRFTLSGQRWLFRGFEQIEAGAVGGAGVALIWSIRYFARALGASNKIATVIVLPFFWLRFFDPWTRRRANLDASSGTFILGRKALTNLRASEMVDYYKAQENQKSAS